MPKSPLYNEWSSSWSSIHCFEFNFLKTWYRRSDTWKGGREKSTNTREKDDDLKEYEDTCGARAAARTLRVDHGREGWWISAVRESSAEESLQAGGEGREWRRYEYVRYVLDVHAHCEGAGSFGGYEARRLALTACEYVLDMRCGPRAMYA